jgi:O-antigen/teichoic acid export membrane protein
MIESVKRRILARLAGSRIGRRVLALAGGTAVAQLIMIGAMPIVTRLYDAPQIGEISLFLAFFRFWAATLSMRYEYALLIVREDAESHVVHRLALIIVVGMSILGLPALWELRRSGTLGFGLLPAWAPYAAVPILMGYGIFMVYRSWALRAGMVREITTATIARSASRTATRVVLGFAGSGLMGLFAAEFAGASGAMLEIARKVRIRFSPSRPPRIKFSVLWRSARTFMKFPVFETPSAWIDQLALTLPVPMIATLHGATAAGWFGLAQMVGGVPVSQVGGAVADALQMELANALIDEDARSARILFYRLLRKLALIGLLPLFCLVALAPWGIPWIFGNKWHESGLAAACIAPWLYAALVISPLSRALSVLQAQEYKLAYDVCAVLFLGLAFQVSKAWGLSFLGTVLAVSMAGFFGYVVYAGVLIVVVERRLNAEFDVAPLSEHTLGRQ